MSALWTPTPMTVTSVTAETADTVTLSLDASQAPLDFSPGQFTMLYAFGKGEVPISISGDPSAPGTLVHTIRGVGSVARPIVELEPGGVLGV